MLEGVDSWLGVVTAMLTVGAGICWVQYTLNRVLDRQTEILSAIQRAVDTPSRTQEKTLDVLESLNEAIREGTRENRQDHQRFWDHFVAQMRKE